MAFPSAKKKRSQAKHKGVKGGGGKKARIAAQRRDRYWGEDVDEEDQKKIRVRRPGEGRSHRSELQKQTTKNAITSDEAAAAGEQWETRVSRVDKFGADLVVESDDDDSVESNDDNMDSTMTSHHFSKLMQSLSSKRTQGRNGSDVSGTVDDESVESHGSEAKTEELADDDADDDRHDTSLCDGFFAGHFSREPMLDHEIPDILQSLHKNVGSIAVDEASLELQASTKLLPTLQTDWAVGLSNPTDPSDASSTAAKRRTIYRRARQYVDNPNEQQGLGMTASSKAIDQNLVAAMLVPAIRTYADVLLTTDSDPSGKSESRASAQNAATRAIHTTMAWHLVEHVHQSRSAIDRHNRRLRRSADKDNAAAADNAIDAIDTDWCRDQGFTRPTVLVLLPTRHCCFDFVQLLVSVAVGDANVASKSDDIVNMDRFDQEYGPASVVPESSEGVDADRRRREVLRQKGADWNDLFGDDRNDDDDFKIGLQLNWKRNTSASSDKGEAGFGGKLYSDFYRSDIILASPLGLKMAMQGRKDDGNDDNDDNGPDKSKGSFDFLSSIEICVVARADVLWHQNWDHVPDILACLNQRPLAMNETDFSRVRQYTLAGQSAHWRQLIVSSNMLDPSIQSCFKRYAKSIQGIVKSKRKSIAVTDSSIASVWQPNIRQVFQRVATASFTSASEDRLKYFLKQIWTKIESHRRGHTMIFVPSYFDFCSLRNALLQKQQEFRGGSSSSSDSIDFVSVTEYSRATEVARGRARFLQGRKPVLLYTGRAHYFLRHAIKGVRHLIFFGLPEVASFYAEHVNRLNEGLKNDDAGVDEAGDTSCLALFTKYDAHSLERIVGSVNCSRMVKGEKSTFLFSSS